MIGPHEENDSSDWQDGTRILQLLTKSVPRQRGLVAFREREPGEHYKLFELLITHILSLIEVDFRWEVTPLHGRGLDFRGEKELFRLPGFEDYVRMVVAGQCRLQIDKQAPVSKDLLHLLHTTNPSVIFVIVAAAIEHERLFEVQRILFHETKRRCLIIDSRGIVRLIAMYFEQLQPILGQILTHGERQEAEQFFRSRDDHHHENLLSEVGKPQQAAAGKPFVITVHIQSVLLTKRAISVSWESSDPIMVVRPSDMARSGGHPLVIEKQFTVDLKLKLIAYQVGTVELGALTLHGDGKEIGKIDLGTMGLVEHYRPIFFWPPHQEHRDRFGEALDLAKAGIAQAMAVVGQGGEGKTRLCEELGMLAEQQGADFISLSHPQNLEQPYALLGQLLQELSPVAASAIDPHAEVEAYFQSAYPALAEQSKDTLAILYSGTSERDRGFEREAMVKLLLVPLVAHTTSIPCVIHLSDLHWCNIEVLDILGEVFQRLGSMSRDLQARCLMLFEGRVQTHIVSAESSGSHSAVSTATFEAFLTRNRIERIHVKPLSTRESEQFLEHIFENSQSSFKKISADLIPHQSALQQMISRRSEGNPFHMIEQIRLLRHQRIIERNRRTGLIFLSRRPTGDFEVPANVFELIRLRLDYIRETNPELVRLVQAVGIIKDRISRSLFNRLRQTLAPEATDHDISRLEMLKTDDLVDVRFRHENYYEVVHGLLLAPDERVEITACYEAWYEELPSMAPENLYELALVLLIRSQSELAHVASLLSQALAQAETNHQYLLAVRILAKQLEVMPQDSASVSSSFDAFIDFLATKTKLANYSLSVQDWLVGADQHRQILESTGSFLQSNPNLGTSQRLRLQRRRAESQVSLANCNTDLGLAREGIELLEDASTTCKLCLGQSFVGLSTEQKLAWQGLYCRTLNRLGEANWMDGNYTEALRWQEHAIQVADDSHLSPEAKEHVQHTNLLDYGAVLLHRDPAQAVEVLEHALAMVPAEGWSPRLLILSRVTVVVGQMVRRSAGHDTVSDAFAAFLRREAIPGLVREFEQAKLFGFKQEQVAASLMLGIAFSVLGDSAASRWHMETIEASFQSNNIESLWRGHLNLAHALDGDDEALEARLHHAGQSLKLLLADLGRRRVEDRTWRLRHLTLPLRCVLAIREAAGVDPGPDLLQMLSEAQRIPLENPEPAGPFATCVTYVRDVDRYYFVYGG